jgi:hypothetical protein
MFRPEEMTSFIKTNTVRNALTVSLLACAFGMTAVVSPESFKGDTALAAPPARLQMAKPKQPSQAVANNHSPGKLHDFARADSGVKLLVGIFNRLGREPQLAQKNENRLLAAKQMYDANRENASQFASSQSNNFASNISAINSGNTDPALAIRPRTAARPKPSDKFIAITGVSIAMAPPKKQLRLEQREQKEQREERESKESLKDRESDARSESKAEKSDSRADARADIKADMDDARIASRSRDEHSVKMISGPSSNSSQNQDKDKTYIREFGAGLSQGNRRPSGEPTLSKAAQVDSLAEAGGIIRPTEQPGLFKYVREHKKDLPKDAPSIAALPSQPARFRFAPNVYSQSPPAAPSGQLGSSNSDSIEMSAKNSSTRAKAKARALSPGGGGGFAAGSSSSNNNNNNSANSASSSAANNGQASFSAGADAARQNTVSENEISLESSEGAPLQVAFLPPSTVHGINGLPLGASESETANYFKNRGNLVKAVISGWKVWTLLDREQNPLIQVYLRGGRTEAFRIFSQSYVPAGLGVSIADELPSMKGKFGEPSFILEEPGVRGNGAMAKNYVYPVSQVSFQLVRTGPRSPQILSLLLFRFL